MRGDSTASLRDATRGRVDERDTDRVEAPAATPARSASVTYTRLDDAIGSARDFTAAFLRARAGDGTAVGQRTVENARLVVSELVTNAVRHAQGPCTVDLRLADGLLEIVVSDTHEAAPVAHAPDPGRVGKHGLEIVLALCRSLDVEMLSPGKRVRASLVVE
ncbi:ATP-binding protein [Streptomyces sp. NPDC015131]|uniref:ATP-binding protein n=1 Tax=Streptomyces sp. NPDC015131 TaxID=3364941 RepID=UPI0036FC98DC